MSLLELFCRSNYILHVCTWLPIHLAAQPGAFEVQTVLPTAVWVEIVQIVPLTMATVRFSQAAEIEQQYVRISYLPAVVVNVLSNASRTLLSPSMRC